MESRVLTSELKSQIGQEIDLVHEGVDRFRVLTPFRFTDGDGLGIVLKRDTSGWTFTDEGHTFMHLSYALDARDLQDGNRRQIIEGVLSSFGVTERNGELVLPTDALGVRLGDGLFSFVQALLHVTDVNYLSRERVRSTFLEDFKSFVRGHAPEGRASFDWHDATLDPDGHYPVDCRLNGAGAPPLFMFAIPGDEKCSVATIAIMYYERAGLAFESLAVFEDMARINRKALARLTDVVGKQFSSLAGNQDRFAGFIGDHVVLTAP